MLKRQWITLLLRTAGFVCLLSMPYTDLRVSREPKAIGHGSDETPADKIAAIERVNQVEAGVALMATDVAAIPMKALLQKMDEVPLENFFLAMSRMVNMNQEVFNSQVDKLPPLSDEDGVDQALRDELKKEFRKSAKGYGTKPQDVLSRAAMQVLMGRLDEKKLALLLQEKTPDARKQLLEKLLRDQALQSTNQPWTGNQGQAHSSTPGRSSSAPRSAATDGSSNGTDKKFKDLSALTAPNAAKASDSTAASTSSKSDSAASSNPSSASRFAGDSSIETPASTPASALAPSVPSADKAPQTFSNAGKKSPLRPIVNFPGQEYLNPVASQGGQSNRMLSIQSNPNNSGISSSNGFPFSASTDQPAVRQKFVYERNNPYRGSTGEDSAEPLLDESEGVSDPIYPNAVSGELGGGNGSSEVPTAPAFSPPMKLTLIGLCASGALNCDHRR